MEHTFCFDGELVYAFIVRRLADGSEDRSSIPLQDPRDQVNPDPDLLLGMKVSNVGRQACKLFCLIGGGDRPFLSLFFRTPQRPISIPTPGTVTHQCSTGSIFASLKLVALLRS